jgi:hypothetical protein
LNPNGVAFDPGRFAWKAPRVARRYFSEPEASAPPARRSIAS